VLVVQADPEIAEDRRHLLRAFGQQCDTALGAAELHAEVQKKETELSAIIHGVPSPIVLIDARNKVIAVNSAAEQLFGISSAFVAGAALKGALGHEQIEQMLASGGAFQAEVEAGSPPRTYKARMSNVHMPGIPMGRVLMLDDVTAEREIAQKQRDFVAMIGHELRTPLTIIKGSSD
jgi:two-component system phosphate regulon sensor histidine kinase PhoR